VVVLAWIALLAGLGAMVGRAIFGAAVPLFWARMGLVVMLAGAVALVARLPRHRPPEDDPYDRYGPLDD
jgi:hypothetical protein